MSARKKILKKTPKKASVTTASLLESLTKTEEFLGSRLRQLGVDEDQIETLCFTLGRMCFGVPIEKHEGVARKILRAVRKDIRKEK